jgi:Domain of unknown function (DUF5710)
MHRTYLFVPPEEGQEVQNLGAHWDNDSKRWYIDLNQSSPNFGKWLPSPEQIDQPDADVFTITSNEAYVASATTSCQRCHRDIEVLCIYCESGTASDEPLTQFTVSDISAIDESLFVQLLAWPTFHKTTIPPHDVYANHCPHCSCPQDDVYLHSEPDDVFFDIPASRPGSVKLTPLAGSVALSGDEHFVVG